MPLAAGKVVCANEWPRIASAEVRPALGLPGPRSPREAEAGGRRRGEDPSAFPTCVTTLLSTSQVLSTCLSNWTPPHLHLFSPSLPSECTSFSPTATISSSSMLRASSHLPGHKRGPSSHSSPALQLLRDRHTGTNLKMLPSWGTFRDSPSHPNRRGLRGLQNSSNQPRPLSLF